MDWPEGGHFGISPDEKVMHAEEAPLQKLWENQKQYVLFTGRSYCIVGKHQRWSGEQHDNLQELLKEEVNQYNLQK